MFGPDFRSPFLDFPILFFWDFPLLFGVASPFFLGGLSPFFFLGRAFPPSSVLLDSKTEAEEGTEKETEMETEVKAEKGPKGVLYDGC